MRNPWFICKSRSGSAVHCRAGGVSLMMGNLNLMKRTSSQVGIASLMMLTSGGLLS